MVQKVMLRVIFEREFIIGNPESFLDIEVAFELHYASLPCLCSSLLLLCWWSVDDILYCRKGALISHSKYSLEKNETLARLESEADVVVKLAATSYLKLFPHPASTVRRCMS